MKFSLLAEADCELAVPGWQGAHRVPQMGGTGCAGSAPRKGAWKAMGNGQQSTAFPSCAAL